jgi:hypothetical protein
MKNPLNRQQKVFEVVRIVAATGGYWSMIICHANCKCPHHR